MDRKNIKIAVVTDDGATICAHFGRALYYEVVTVENGAVTARERREKPGHHTHHTEVQHHSGLHVIQGGLAEESHAHNHGGHGQGHHSHDRHKGMADVISDCQMVLARGMGYGAYASMEQFNIVPCVTDIPTIDDAVEAVIDGTIVDHTEKLH